VRELDVHDVSAAPALAVRDEAAPGREVGEEVAEPARPAPARRAFGNRVQLIFGGLQQAGVLVGVVEEVGGVGYERHGNRQVRVGDETRRTVAAGIRELAHRAARDDEEAARTELERSALDSIRPHRGEPLPVRDVDDLVECEAHGLGRAPRRDLGDARVGNSFHALELDECGVAFHLRPRGDFQVAHVLHVVARVNGQFQRFDPLVVWMLLGPRVSVYGDLLQRYDVCLLRHGSPPSLSGLSGWTLARGARFVKRGNHTPRAASHRSSGCTCCCSTEMS